MSYNTTSEFIQYAYPSGSYSNISSSVIQFELDSAASEINAALRGYHTLPLATGSYGRTSDLAMIYKAEIVIASYNLMVFKGFKPNADEADDSVLRNKYLEIKGEGGFLDMCRQGKYLFPTDADSTPSSEERRPRVYGNTGRSIRVVDSNGREYV